DLGLAIITTIIQITSIRNSGQPYAWLTVFQILRVYRVVMAVSLTRELIVSCQAMLLGSELIMYSWLFLGTSVVLETLFYLWHSSPSFRQSSQYNCFVVRFHKRMATHTRLLRSLRFTTP